MTVLRGPSDADHYRVKVGRYGDRWYTDPLPSCPIAEASDWQGPSWSIVKGAAGKDWSYVANKRNGHADRGEIARISQLEEPDQRTQAFNAINKNGLTQAGGRGTIVHLWAEDLLAGRGPRIITDPVLFALKLPRAALDEATEYLEALAAFFDHYQPEVIAAEYVALHRTLNGVGYGCTPDVIAVVQGQTVGIDWKTRGADSDHGAYPEEAAQIAAGAKAEYMIIATLDEGRPVRRLIPHIDCGIVVSIKPDGHRIYPTDIDLGFRHVEAMHAFWTARLVEKQAIGKPWPPIPVQMDEELAYHFAMQDEIEGEDPTPTKETTCLTPSTTSSPDSTNLTATSKRSKPNSAKSSTSSPTSTPLTENSPSPSATSTPDDYTATSTILATAMLEWTPELRQYLKDWWPADTPNPGQIRRGQAIWTSEQLTAIEELCDLGDAPFWQPAEPQTRQAS